VRNQPQDDLVALVNKRKKLIKNLNKKNKSEYTELIKKTKY